MFGNASFTREKARMIDEAFQRMQNHRDHYREEQRLPPHRRDNLSPGALCSVDLETEHGIQLLTWIRDGKFEVKVNVESLARSRRAERMEDVSLFFESLEEKIRRAADDHLDCVDGSEIQCELSFQGRDTDAFYRYTTGVTEIA